MSINAILNSGLSALLANQTALRTTASNVSNVNTPGYVRRTVQFETQSSNGYLGGVNVGSIERAVDRYLNGQRLSSGSDAGEASVADRFLDQLQKAMGGAQNGRDPASRLSALSAGLAQLAADPASSARRAELLQSMRDFAQGINDLANQAQTLRQQADREVGDATTRINDLTTRIAELNMPIQQATVRGDMATALRDERDIALRELSELIEINVSEAANGRVQVTTPSGYTLVSATTSEISHIDLGGASAQTVFPGLTITRRNLETGAQVGQVEPFERHVSGGSLRGLLDMRDVTLPNVAQEIGALAAGAAEAYNAASNDSSSWPAPARMAGRDTGLLAGDAHGFTGKTTLAVVDAQGQLIRRIDIDFSAGSLSVDGAGGGPIGTTIGSLVSAIDGALAGVGTASFADGALTLNATSGGIAFKQDAADPSSRAGRGFAHTFGLNDIFVSSAPTSFATGLTAADAHGFAGGQVEFALRGPDGALGQRFTYTVGGTSVGDMVAGLNAAAGAAGSFALGPDGAITFTAAGGAAQRLELISDTTQRGGTSRSLSAMFGLGQRYQMEQGANFAVSPRLAQNPSGLALAQLDLGATNAAGDLVLASGDNKGVLALQKAGASVVFPPAGDMTGRTVSLSDYASNLVSSLGQRSAFATTRAADATAFKDEIEARALQKEGVNLDEELASMIMFQQAYSAGARLITTAQQLYDELLGMMK